MNILLFINIYSTFYFLKIIRGGVNVIIQSISFGLT
jgi:hypothetical protein